MAVCFVGKRQRHIISLWGLGGKNWQRKAVKSRRKNSLKNLLYNYSKYIVVRQISRALWLSRIRLREKAKTKSRTLPGRAVTLCMMKMWPVSAFSDLRSPAASSLLLFTILQTARLLARQSTFQMQRLSVGLCTPPLSHASGLSAWLHPLSSPSPSACVNPQIFEPPACWHSPLGRASPKSPASADASL